MPIIILAYNKVLQKYGHKDYSFEWPLSQLSIKLTGSHPDIAHQFIIKRGGFIAIMRQLDQLSELPAIEVQK